MFKVPAWSQVDSPYYFYQTNSDSLLITVGDSWTWGDSLGNTKARLKKDDADYRLAHVYGRLISQQLNSSWINLALPGISNYQMLSWLEHLLQITPLDYKKIHCVITLTESGRHEEIQLLNPLIDSLQENLQLIVSNTYSRIQQLQNKYSQIRFVTAHNFTDPGKNYSGVEQSWLEVMLGQRIQNQTHVVVSEHIQQLNWDRVYPDTANIIDRALARVDLLDKCEYCVKEDSRHPTESGHRAWADYLLEQI